MQPLGTCPVILNVTLKTNLLFVIIAITLFFPTGRRGQKIIAVTGSECLWTKHRQMCSSLLAPDKLSLAGHLPGSKIPGRQAGPHLWIFPHTQLEEPPQSIPQPTAHSRLLTHSILCHFSMCSSLMLTFQSSSALACSVQPWLWHRPTGMIGNGSFFIPASPSPASLKMWGKHVEGISHCAAVHLQLLAKVTRGNNKTLDESQFLCHLNTGRKRWESLKKVSLMSS